MLTAINLATFALVDPRYGGLIQYAPLSLSYMCTSDVLAT